MSKSGQWFYELQEAEEEEEAAEFLTSIIRQKDQHENERVSNKNIGGATQCTAGQQPPRGMPTFPINDEVSF